MAEKNYKIIAKKKYLVGGNIGRKKINKISVKENYEILTKKYKILEKKILSIKKKNL